MLSTESLVAPGSDYYIYTPSTQAQGLFLYPLIVGHFQYLPGYCLRRTSLDSFLIMHITRGGCEVECGGHRFRAREGQIVMLDCYAPHAYHRSPTAGKRNGSTSMGPAPGAISTPFWPEAVR